MLKRIFNTVANWLSFRKSDANISGFDNQIGAEKHVPALEEASRQEQKTLAIYDEHLLDRVRTQWQSGDWENLVKLNIKTLENHPDRAKLALFVSAGHQQTGDMALTKQFIRLAQDWGCSQKFVRQILIAGVHNTLGRARVSVKEDDRAIQHYESAILVVMPHADIRLLAQSRIIRESAKLGLLPQAARFMGQKLCSLKRTPSIQSSHFKIFETELDLLNNELSLAQQRQQLFNQAMEKTAKVELDTCPEWLEKVKKTSCSQLGQDLWVLEQSAYKRNGFFVEFGATDGVLLSNTFLLEKGFAWQGICAEPNPKFFENLKINRRCTVSDNYISGETGKEVEFILASAYGSSQEYAREDGHCDKRIAYRNAGQVTTIVSISLHDFLKQHNAPREIDYLSIDTEGSEYEILQAFPFDQWDIRLLTIEHNFTEHRVDIRKLLEREGYRCTEQQFDDWYERVNV